MPLHTIIFALLLLLLLCLGDAAAVVKYTLVSRRNRTQDSHKDRSMGVLLSSTTPLDNEGEDLGTTNSKMVHTGPRPNPMSTSKKDVRKLGNEMS
jgi:hypothetical protein